MDIHARPGMSKFGIVMRVPVAKAPETRVVVGSLFAFVKVRANGQYSRAVLSAQRISCCGYRMF